MKKYIVKWTVIAMLTVPCPDNVIDDITGLFPSTACEVLHYEKVESVKHKTFETYKEAYEFAKQVRKRKSSLQDARLLSIKDIRIDTLRAPVYDTIFLKLKNEPVIIK